MKEQEFSQPTDKEIEEIADSLFGKSEPEKHYGFYQLCPKCEGEDQIPNIGMSSSVWRTCPVCNGAKLLVRPEIKNDVRVPTENEIDFINFK